MLKAPKPKLNHKKQAGRYLLPLYYGRKTEYKGFITYRFEKLF